MAGHYKFAHPNPNKFPDEPLFSHFLTPNRFEGDIYNLEVEGKIPPELDGTFYRVMPDPAQAPFVKNDVWFNGDGLISAFRIKDGFVDFKQRYVKTEKLLREREARRALLGKYRNKYTDAVEFQIRTMANTNILFHAGVMLACKEDGPPYAMDPDTLDTIGVWDFNGQLESATFTAHPKFDPHTGDMLTFGYEAKGDGTPDVCYFVVDATGKITQTVWMIAPVVGMIHDFAFTKNYVIFPMIPLIASLERMKAGGDHWAFDPKVPCYFGVLPRYGAKGEDVKWFEAPNGFMGHVSAAYENEEGKIVIDLVQGEQNVFFFWPDVDGNMGSPEGVYTRFRSFTIDYHSKTPVLPKAEEMGPYDAEFPRIDERYMGSKYKHCFMDVMIKSETDWPAIEKRMGAGFPLYNNVAHFNRETREWRMFSVGDTSMVQEPVFIPRSPDAPEGDGFVVALVSRYETFSSDLIILDTRDWTKPAAVVKLPCKLRPGIHGNWVDASEIAKKITNGASLINGSAHTTTASVNGRHGATNGTTGS